MTPTEGISPIIPGLTNGELDLNQIPNNQPNGMIQRDQKLYPAPLFYQFWEQNRSVTGKELERGIEIYKCSWKRSYFTPMNIMRMSVSTILVNAVASRVSVCTVIREYFNLISYKNFPLY